MDKIKSVDKIKKAKGWIKLPKGDKIKKLKGIKKAKGTRGTRWLKDKIKKLKGQGPMDQKS